MIAYRKIIHVLLFALILTIMGTGPSIAGTDVPLMTTDELKAMLGNPDLVILDVRKGKDWKSSEFKIKGATYAKPDNYAKWANTFDKTKKIVLYCA